MPIIGLALPGGDGAMPSSRYAAEPTSTATWLAASSTSCYRHRRVPAGEGASREASRSAGDQELPAVLE